MLSRLTKAFKEKNQSKISNEIDQFNEVNKKISDQYNIKYISITDISRQAISDPSLVAPDGLHPSGKMYSLWAQRITNQVTLK